MKDRPDLGYFLTEQPEHTTDVSISMIDAALEFMFPRGGNGTSVALVFNTKEEASDAVHNVFPIRAAHRMAIEAETVGRPVDLSYRVVAEKGVILVGAGAYVVLSNDTHTDLWSKLHSFHGEVFINPTVPWGREWMEWEEQNGE